MKRLSKLSVLIVALMILCFSAVSFAADAKAPAVAAPAVVKQLKVGDTITDFKLPDAISKASVSFDKDIKGKSKVIAISFMTTSCTACKAEMGLLSDLVNKFGDDFKAYAVSVDINGEKTVPAYDKTFGFSVKYLLDPDFATPQKFGFSYTPSLVIASKDGKILYLKGGYSPSSDPDEIINAVKSALK